jgi:hypothetical protein
MSDLDKVHRLLASAPLCRQRIEQMERDGGPCSQAQFAELAGLWQGAHGPMPAESLLAGFGWTVREENTLRWCLARLRIAIEAPPAHGETWHHPLPLGRERLDVAPHKHVIGED